MKTLLYIILGIILGLACIRCAISSVSALIHFELTSSLISGALALLLWYVAKKCFGKI